MTKIVLFENIHASSHAVFQAAGYTDIVTHASALSSDALLSELRTANVVGIRSRTQLTRERLEVAENLQAIGCFCIGTNQVDLGAAMHRGIPVFNAPFSNTRSVAELVLAEAILLLRRIPEKNARVHLGHWDKTASGAYEARGKTLGIIGYGNIGGQVGTLAESLGMRVIFYDIDAKLPLGNARQTPDLATLLIESDVVTLHVPATRTTENMINADTLAQMKKGAMLINASRGTVVDIDALHVALQSGQVGGAAIDVFPVEPRSPDEPLRSPLVNMPNVILTPHIGGSTMEAQENIGREVAEKLVNFLVHGATKGAVNFPELPVSPREEGATRILHVHRNVPGALATLNNLFAEHGLNIASQSLQTREDIGYVLTDLMGGPVDAALEDLRKHSFTVRVERFRN